MLDTWYHILIIAIEMDPCMPSEAPKASMQTPKREKTFLDRTGGLAVLLWRMFWKKDHTDRLILDVHAFIPGYQRRFGITYNDFGNQHLGRPKGFHRLTVW